MGAIFCVGGYNGKDSKMNKEDQMLKKARREGNHIRIYLIAYSAFSCTDQALAATAFFV